MVIKREMRFSIRYSKEFGVPVDKIIPFFQNEFQLCLIGKADLKEEIQKYLKSWHWKGTTDELLNYWFSNEKNVNKEMLDNIHELKSLGIKCFISTQNEKYIVDYVLNSIGLKQYFDRIFATSEIGHLKSDQKFWQSIYEQLGNPDKKTILCWDDNEEFVKMAKDAGLLAEHYTNFEDYKNKTKKYLNN